MLFSMLNQLRFISKMSFCHPRQADDLELVSLGFTSQCMMSCGGVLIEDHPIKLLHLGGAVLGSERPLLPLTVVHAFEKK